MTRIAALISHGGAVPGLQMAHAGRKASVDVPWRDSKPVPLESGGWTPVAATGTPFGPHHNVPHAMSTGEIAGLVEEWAACTRRARAAGIKVIELHGAHGYLVHSFLSPISNTRNDQYGGDLAGRSRLLMELVEAVRGEWPDDLPLFVRLSCVDWMAGGLTLDNTVSIAKALAATGKVDLIDCSSGGIAATGPSIPSLHPGYQVPFAEAVRQRAGIATGAVGLIAEPEHAEEIVANSRADLVFVARAVLADPAWPLRAAHALGAPVPLMPQYARGRVA
jgi:2,4-dienoyl-CoA reductase-like NADH-dependent reductase (Old Yellow Enzyme family)